MSTFFPSRGDGHMAQSEVCMPNSSPIWNATLMFDIGNGEHLINRSIEITLWDLIPQNESIFLGECCIDLQVNIDINITSFADLNFLTIFTQESLVSI
jgi:C2 domain